MITAQEARRRVDAKARARIDSTLEKITAKIEGAIEREDSHVYWPGLQQMPDVQKELKIRDYTITLDNSGGYISW